MRLLSIIQPRFLEPMDPRRESHTRLHHLDAKVLIKAKLHQRLRRLHRILDIFEATCRLVRAGSWRRILEDGLGDSRLCHGLLKSCFRGLGGIRSTVDICIGLVGSLHIFRGPNMPSSLHFEGLLARH